MKSIIIVLLIAVTIMLSVVIFQKHGITQELNQVGRFQLFQGKHGVVVEGVNSEEVNDVFLLDTVTGQASTFFVGATKGNVIISKWIPCERNTTTKSGK